MKEEALRRASQMHRSVPYTPIKKDSPEVQKKPSQLPLENTPSKEENRKDNNSPKEVNSPPALFEDKEKLLILMLLLLLSSEENSDPVVTLALLYLII